jgi:hypothetical protein
MSELNTEATTEIKPKITFKAKAKDALDGAILGTAVGLCYVA